MPDSLAPVIEADATSAAIAPEDAVTDLRVTWLDADGAPVSGTVVNIDGLTATPPTVQVAPDSDPTAVIDLGIDILEIQPADDAEDVAETPEVEGEMPDAEDIAEAPEAPEAPEDATEVEVSPWTVVADHPECTGPEGTVAVVAVDPTGAEVSVESCHPDEASAQAHIDELIAADVLEDEVEVEDVAEIPDAALPFATLNVDVAVTNMSELERAVELANQLRSTMDVLAALAPETTAVEAVAEFTAIAEHSTATDDGAWDGPANEAQVTSPSTENYFDSIYAWRDDEADTTVKAAYRFIHHFVSADGDSGAASTVACSTGIGVINGGRGGTTIPEADRHGVYTHLAHHLKDAGKDAPEMLSQDAYEAALAVSNAAATAPESLSDASQDDLVAELARRFADGVAADLAAAELAAAELAMAECPDCGGTGKLPSGAVCPTCEGTGKVESAPAAAASVEAAVVDAAEAADAPVAEVPAADAPAAPAESTATYDWDGVLIVEGMASGDGRMIGEGALTWRQLPIPLMLQTVNASGHEGAIICGSIHEISRDGQNILGTGNFDSGAAGQEALRLLTEGTMRGVSADIDSVVSEFLTEAGEAVPIEAVMFDGVKAVEVLVEGRIMGATLTPFPAFQEAHVTVSSSSTPSESMVASGADYLGDVWHVPSPIGAWVAGQEPATLVASAALTSLVASAAASDIVDVPARPPAAWFEIGNMTEPVPFTISEDGRCYGLVATFGSCHIGFSDRCVPVPKTASGYKHFRNKSVLSEEGALIATGPIFMDTVHPNLRMKASDAQAHYAHTGCAFADVALYENEFGIVAAGGLRPGLTEKQVRAARASDVSPDWRTINGRLEVVGLLSVNVSGFVVEGLVASGAEVSYARGRYDSVTDQVTALVAAGMVQSHSVEYGLAVLESSEVLSDLTAQVSSMHDALEEFVLAPAREAREARLAAARQALGLKDEAELRAERLAAAQERFGLQFRSAERQEELAAEYVADAAEVVAETVEATVDASETVEAAVVVEAAAEVVVEAAAEVVVEAAAEVVEVATEVEAGCGGSCGGTEEVCACEH